MKTADLIGPALDWAVAKCEGFTDYDPLTEKIMPPRKEYGWVDMCELNYSTDWSQGGPIIERERINVHLLDDKPDIWAANLGNPWKALPNVFSRLGPTPLIAAMRCYVASKSGDEIEIPQGLV